MVRNRARTRMVRIDETRRQSSAGCGADEQLELAELPIRHGYARVLVHVLERAKEEHPIAQNRTTERSPRLLAAVRNLLAILERSEIVLRRQCTIPKVHKPGAMGYVRSRLRDHRDRDTPSASICGGELTRRELELLEGLEREIHQRATLTVVAIVRAIDSGTHVRT